jgi:hypothetical protein
MWEIDDAVWEKVCDRVRSQLQIVARVRGTVSYSDLVIEVNAGAGEGERFESPRSHALADMLGQINASEKLYLGEPLLLSAVVVYFDEPYPGVGFFASAKHLGCAVPDDDIGQRVFWGREIERVWEAYGRKGDGR